MKRYFFLIIIGALALSIGCGWFDNHNDIEYPVDLRMDQRRDDLVTLWFYLYFKDQTPEDDGVYFDWEKRGDTLWFLFQEEEGDVDWNDEYYNTRYANLKELGPGTYTLLFEGYDEEKKISFLYTDTLFFEVEDSVYKLEEYRGDVVNTELEDYEIRRLFPDMLLAGIASKEGQEYYSDSFRMELSELGAEPCTVSSGDYTMFEVWKDGKVIVPLHNGWVVGGVPQLYTYSNDTTDLTNLGEAYKDKIEGLALRMGNGFGYGFGIYVIE